MSNEQEKTLQHQQREISDNCDLDTMMVALEKAEEYFGDILLSKAQFEIDLIRRM